MYKHLIFNVDELWLKGKNRPLYFKALQKHLRSVLKAHHRHPFKIINEHQRLVAHSEESFSEALIQATVKIPGLSNITPSRAANLDLDSVMEKIVEELQLIDPHLNTFKVNTKRPNKNFSMCSMDISAKIGHQVLLAFPHLKVDVRQPKIVIELRILDQFIYVSAQKLVGIGGLPNGTSGRAVTLLSGGFDSPVASFLMAKRGVRQSLVFFHAYPYVGDEVVEKIVGISKVLAGFQNGTCLCVIPFGAIQQKIAESCLEDYRTLFFRLIMLKCAALLAEKIGASALLTGDVLGQVSSQTMENMVLQDSFVSKLILRPLVGYNKREIIDLAKKIGTHDLSVVPHDDACSLFAPTFPIIRPKRDYVERYFQENNFDDIMTQAIDSAQVLAIDVAGKTYEKTSVSAID